MRGAGLSVIAVALFTARPASADPAPPPRVQGERIVQHIEALSEFGRNPQGGVSRVAYTEADRQGRDYVMRLMRDAGLSVQIDAAGNIVGRLAGGDPALPPILLGSHIDSVPNGGNYDGDVGSLGAVEVAQVLVENRLALRHPLEVIVFENEEGVTVGSHALASGVEPALLDSVSQSGRTIRDGIQFLGGDVAALASARRAPGSITAYLELHIEQGGVLDREKTDIGVVEGIVGILHSEARVEGFANHAGTTPMDQRHDALLSAAELVAELNRIVTRAPGRQVGTVGWIHAEPGAYNVIPGVASFGVELRDLDEAKVDSLFGELRAAAERIGRARGTRVSFSEPVKTRPALTDPRLQRLIDRSAKALGFSTRLMPSGAGHDAQEIARIGPVGMIFIPSVGGISHAPTEFSRPRDIENGANVLLRAVLELDRNGLAEP